MAWLMTLARSRAFDHLRRRDEAVSHPEPESLIEDGAEPHDNPATLLSSAQRDQCLNAALEQLNPLQRQLLALAFYRGLTHDEIAQQTQLPLGTVKSHIRRGLSSLRETLAENGNTHMGLTS
jgi:RNA polymerase sigma factor (sigma-70 family)